MKVESETFIQISVCKNETVRTIRNQTLQNLQNHLRRKSLFFVTTLPITSNIVQNSPSHLAAHLQKIRRDAKKRHINATNKTLLIKHLLDKHTMKVKLSVLLFIKTTPKKKQLSITFSFLLIVLARNPISIFPPL